MLVNMSCQRSILFSNAPTSTIAMLAQYLLIVCLIIQSKCDESYTNKYDGVDLDEVLASERLLNGYVKCLLDNGPCTPDAKELKKNLPDAIENDCKKCNKRQRNGADKIMHFIIDNRPEDWQKLEQKYNSDGSYKQKYMARLKTEDEKSVECKEKDDEKPDEKLEE